MIHTKILWVLAIMLLLAPSFVTALDEQIIILPSYCIVEGACIENIGQEVCAEQGGIYYGPGQEEGINLCTEGCCTLGTGETILDVTRAFCNSVAGEFGEDDCPPPPAIPNCSEGGTNCLCGMEVITSGFVCCMGSIVEGTTCPTTPTPPPGDIGELCGDGIAYPDQGIICDGTDITHCPQAPTGRTQQCTPACTCLYDPVNDYEPGTCNPQEQSCTETECEQIPQLGLTVRNVHGFPHANITYTIPQTCALEIQSISLFIPGVYAFTPGAMSDTIVVENFNAETEYEVILSVTYSISGQEQVRTIQRTFNPGDAACTDGVVAYCQNANLAINCNLQNIAQEISCGTGLKCVTASEAGDVRALCVNEVPCSDCNKAHQSFGEVSENRISFTIGNTEHESVLCSELERFQIGQERFGLCYLDFTTTILQEYNSCSQVTSCSTYNSQRACDNNPCLVRHGCEWNNEVDFCVSSRPELIQCSQAYSEQTCDSLGEQCMWLDNRCRNRNDMLFCDQFETPDACHGGTPFQLDRRTNIPIRESQNRFDLPKCIWSNNVCRADPSGLSQTRARLTDFQNPQTTLLTNTNAIESVQPIIRFAATDNVQVFRTYARVYEQRCEGLEHDEFESTGLVDRSRGIFNLSDITEPGEYCLRYFSQDMNDNREEVREVTLLIPEGLLFIEEPNYEVIQNYPWANSSQIRISWQTNRRAFCELKLSGTTMHAGTSNDRFQFINTHQEGTYSYEVICKQGTTTIRKDLPVTIHLDARVQRSLPFLTNPAYPPGTRTLGIHKAVGGELEGICQYRDGTEWITMQPTGQPQNIIINGYSGPWQAYTRTKTITESGFYRYPTRCFFGTEAARGPDITFAVDAQPPRIEITTILDGQETLITQSQTVAVPEEGLSISVRCRKTPVHGDEETPGTFTAPVERITMNGETLTAQNQLLTGSGQTRFICVDVNGLQATPLTLTRIEEDFTGPERPEFSAE